MPANAYATGRTPAEAKTKRPAGRLIPVDVAVRYTASELTATTTAQATTTAAIRSTTTRGRDTGALRIISSRPSASSAAHPLTCATTKSEMSSKSVENQITPTKSEI